MTLSLFLNRDPCGVFSDGSPCHPLYLPLELKPFPMPLAAESQVTNA